MPTTPPSEKCSNDNKELQPLARRCRSTDYKQKYEAYPREMKMLIPIKGYPVAYHLHYRMVCNVLLVTAPTLKNHSYVLEHLEHLECALPISSSEYHTPCSRELISKSCFSFVNKQSPCRSKGWHTTELDLTQLAESAAAVCYYQSK